MKAFFVDWKLGKVITELEDRGVKIVEVTTIPGAESGHMVTVEDHSELSVILEDLGISEVENV